MKKILVPFDFSDYAQYAFNFAFQIAKNTNSNLILLYIIEYPIGSAFNTMGEMALDDVTDSYLLEMIKRAKEDMEELIKDPKYEGVPIEYEVNIGKPFESIAKGISDYKSDLAVMGTKGTSGFKEFFIGSNTEKVVRFAKCPVITVSDDFKFSEIRSIVYGTDLNEPEYIIEKLKQWQNLFNAKLHLVWIHTPHVIKNEEKMKDEMTKFTVDHKIENYTVNIFKAIAPDEGIMYFAEEIYADMIAISTHGRKGLAHIFSGSLAEDIVNHADRPVWTLSMKAVPETAKN